MSRIKQEPSAGENDDNSSNPLEWTMDTSGDSDDTTIGDADDGNELKEMKLKMAALKAKNKMLKTKVENQKLRAKLRDKSMERVKMENNQLKGSIQEIQQSVDKLAKENAELKGQQNQSRQEIEEFPMEMALKQEEEEEVDEEEEDEKEEEEEDEDEDEEEQMADEEEEEQVEVEDEEDEDETINIVKIANTNRNGWKETLHKNVQISADGLTLVDNNPKGEILQHFFAVHGFSISPEHCRHEQQQRFGPIVYYFEITQITRLKYSLFRVGLSDGCMLDGKLLGQSEDSYAFWKSPSNCCWASWKKHEFEWPNGAIKPKWDTKKPGDVVGCGILLDSKNKLFIFYTGNGILMGRQIPISPSVDRLFPTVRTINITVEANFGDNPVKPFKYDIHKCPGLVFQ